jgi:molybdenum cofactor biosynthesis enzyme
VSEIERSMSAARALLELLPKGHSYRLQAAELKAEIEIVRERINALCAQTSPPTTVELLAVMSVTREEIAARVAETGDQS